MCSEPQTQAEDTVWKINFWVIYLRKYCFADIAFCCIISLY